MLVVRLQTLKIGFSVSKRCKICNNGQKYAFSTQIKGQGTPAKENKYSKTVLLPLTKFDQRANSFKKEPELQTFWSQNNTYKRLQKSNTGQPFVLHDGPPYANGTLHIGHALNKILKDVINKYHILKGRKVSFVPGWDCHGLPIELKILHDMKSKDRQALTPIQLRKTAAAFAKNTMEAQRESFKRYGVWGDWDEPYLTMQPQYEAAQIGVFGDMVAKGYIYRGKRPVNWSPSSRTALAEAELEYPEEHTSRSVYLGFKATKLSLALVNALPNCSNDVRVTVWTTTPWTIPANSAVAVNANLEYSIIHHSSLLDDTKFIVATELVATFANKMGLDTTAHPLVVDAVLFGHELVDTEYQHPLYDRVSKIVAGGDYITTQSGTGLVHTAPGHGQEDYLVGLKYNLPLLSPVDDAGCFTSEAGKHFVGLDVLGKGNEAVISALRDSGALLKEEAYKHKYPYDWRTKKPTICRMTEQWFADVSRFKDASMTAIDSVEWIPAAGRNRIAAMVESRGEWCISRQRAWGVPIPVFYHKDTNAPLMTAETIAHIANVIREHGADAWWEMSVEQLLPEGKLRESASEYVKGLDTMDVWFDSGTSWAGVLRDRKELKFPADLYLEGSDQHRGWFQSSLLTSVATQGIAPYKKVLTHGFVMDEKGYKMSKSLGNVVDPKIVIEGGTNQKEQPAYGADTLRLWVAGVDYTGDAAIGNNVIKQNADSYRKIRNTLRFMLGSLSDFTPQSDLVSYEDLPSLDKNALGKLSTLIKSIETAYDEYQFYKISNSLVKCSFELSAFYMETAKDRLYVSHKNDVRRKACQTVMYHLVTQLSIAMAPILPHLAEEVWQSMVGSGLKNESIFDQGWIKQSSHFPEYETELWDTLRLVRDGVNKGCTLARIDKKVGATTECCVYLYAEDPQLQKILLQLKGDEQYLPHNQSTNNVDDLRFLFTVSQVVIVNSIEEIRTHCPDYFVPAEESNGNVSVGVVKAKGVKCNRCWLYCTSVGTHHEHTDLCLRCADVMKVDNHVLTV